MPKQKKPDKPEDRRATTTSTGMNNTITPKIFKFGVLMLVMTLMAAVYALFPQARYITTTIGCIATIAAVNTVFAAGNASSTARRSTRDRITGRISENSAVQRLAKRIAANYARAFFGLTDGPRTLEKAEIKARQQNFGVHTLAVLFGLILAGIFYFTSGTAAASAASLITATATEALGTAYLRFARFAARAREEGCSAHATANREDGQLILHQGAMLAPSSPIANGLAWAGLFGREAFGAITAIALLPLARIMPSAVGNVALGLNLANHLKRIGDLAQQAYHGVAPEDVPDIIEQRSLLQQLKRAFIYASIFAIPIIIVLAVIAFSVISPPVAAIPIVLFTAAAVIALATGVTYFNLDHLDRIFGVGTSAMVRRVIDKFIRFVRRIAGFARRVKDKILRFIRRGATHVVREHIGTARFNKYLAVVTALFGTNPAQAMTFAVTPKDFEATSEEIERALGAPRAEVADLKYYAVPAGYRSENPDIQQALTHTVGTRFIVVDSLTKTIIPVKAMHSIATDTETTAEHRSTAGARRDDSAKRFFKRFVEKFWTRHRCTPIAPRQILPPETVARPTIFTLPPQVLSLLDAIQAHQTAQREVRRDPRVVELDDHDQLIVPPTSPSSSAGMQLVVYRPALEGLMSLSQFTVVRPGPARHHKIAALKTYFKALKTAVREAIHSGALRVVPVIPPLPLAIEENPFTRAMRAHTARQAAITAAASRAPTTSTGIAQDPAQSTSTEATKEKKKEEEGGGREEDEASSSSDSSETSTPPEQEQGSHNANSNPQTGSGGEKKAASDFSNTDVNSLLGLFRPQKFIPLNLTLKPNNEDKDEDMPKIPNPKEEYEQRKKEIEEMLEELHGPAKISRISEYLEGFVLPPDGAEIPPLPVPVQQVQEVFSNSSSDLSDTREEYKKAMEKKLRGDPNTPDFFTPHTDNEIPPLPVPEETFYGKISTWIYNTVSYYTPSATVFNYELMRYALLAGTITMSSASSLNPVLGNTLSNSGSMLIEC